MRAVLRKGFNQAERIAISKLFASLKYFALSMLSLALSMCFPVVEKQLLVLSVITGAKWITDSVRGATKIIIIERG